MNKTITAPEMASELLPAGKVLTVEAQYIANPALLLGKVQVKVIKSGVLQSQTMATASVVNIGPYAYDVQVLIQAMVGTANYRDFVITNIDILTMENDVQTLKALAGI